MATGVVQAQTVFMLMDKSAETESLYADGPDKAAAFRTLLADVEAMKEANPDSAEAWAMTGITRLRAMTTDDDFGIFNSIRAGRQLRAELGHAVELDASALDGLAMAVLGRATALGFGSADEARAYLDRALAISPAGLDTNFQYGLFLLNQGDMEGVRRHFAVAMAAPVRATTPKWDQHVKATIDIILSDL